MRTIANQLILLFLLLCFSNITSGQANCICNGEDLAWLEDVKNNLADEILNPPITPCGSTEGNISMCNYLGQTVFSYLPTSLPCDVGPVVVDCNGDFLFSYGGFCNGPCLGDEQAALLTDCELIYSAPAFAACDDSCTGSGDVVLAVGCVDAEVGATNVCIPLTVRNFSNVTSTQTGVTWDPLELSYSSVNEVSLTNITLNENDISNGTLRILWLTPFNAPPVTLIDNTILFELCFNVLGPSGSSTNISLDDLSDFIIEVVNNSGMAEDLCIQEGQINIGTPNGGEPGDFLQELVSCEAQAIPTMDEWSLISLSLLLLIFASQLIIDRKSKPATEVLANL